MFWDLYNEPANTLFQKEYHFKLLKKVFAWARTIDPSQPITTGIYLPDMEINPFLIENSDIITFHCYADPEYTEQQTLKMLQYDRPVICTEWMLRTQNSTIKAIMPRFKELHVGSIIWVWSTERHKPTCRGVTGRRISLTPEFGNATFFAEISPHTTQPKSI